MEIAPAYRRGPERRGAPLCGGPLENGCLFEHFRLVKSSIPDELAAAIRVEEDRRGLAPNSQSSPGFERGVVQHSKRRRAVLLDERIGFLQTVLSAEAYRGQLVLVFASKLLDTRRLAPANWSVRGPKPQKNWLGLENQHAKIDVPAG